MDIECKCKSGAVSCNVNNNIPEGNKLLSIPEYNEVNRSLYKRLLEITNQTTFMTKCEICKGTGIVWID